MSYYDNYDAYRGAQFGAKIQRCYETHKPLKVGDFEVYGGSCSNPLIKDADVYIGFDRSMSFSKKSWPWLDSPRPEVYFEIVDMTAPANPEEFLQLIAWSADQIKAGKKLHAGCIGGHGRTGTFLAALVTHMTGEKDSISYVRTNYCAKAVESQAQVDFLNKHFGITPQASSKSPYPKTTKQKQLFGSEKPFSSKKTASSKTATSPKAATSKSTATTIPKKSAILPVNSLKSIWIKPVVLGTLI